jgi:hypothetical protein
MGMAATALPLALLLFSAALATAQDTERIEGTAFFLTSPWFFLARATIDLRCPCLLLNAVVVVGRGSDASWRINPMELWEHGRAGTWRDLPLDQLLLITLVLASSELVLRLRRGSAACFVSSSSMLSEHCELGHPNELARQML